MGRGMRNNRDVSRGYDAAAVLPRARLARPRGDFSDDVAAAM